MATLEELLAKLDLSKFTPKFQEQDVDLDTAKAMSEAELKELGLTLGAAKRLHLALQGGNAGGASAAAAAAAKVPAHSAASASSVPLNMNISGWKWMFDGKMWPGNASGLTGGAGIEVRMFDQPDTTSCFSFCKGYGNINHPVCIWDVEAGQPIQALENKVGAHIGADQMGNLVAQVGEHFSFAMWSVPEMKLLHEGKTPTLTLCQNGDSLMFCALLNSGTGAPQLAATDYSFGSIWIWDVGTGNPTAKFKIPSGECGHNLLRDPFNPATLMFAANGKTFVIDTRAKAISRKLVNTGDGYSFSIPSTSGGKIITRGSEKHAFVVDYASGKLLHKIKCSEEGGATMSAVAMAGNCVGGSVSSAVGRDGGFHFWDLNGAPEEVKESGHSLKYSQPSSAVAMSPKYLVAFAISYGNRSFKNT